MRYRPVRGLAVEVSELSFGCGAVGGLLVRGGFEEQCEVFRAALAAGVNFFDTGSTYGNGASEVALGKVFAEIGERPVVATKFQLRGDDFDDIAGAVRRSVEQSLTRLGFDHIDILYAHDRMGRVDDPRLGGLSPNTMLRAGGVADVMDRLVDEGLVSSTAFCAFGHTASALEVLGSDRFAMIQVPVNVLNPSAVRAAAPAWRHVDYGEIANVAAASGVAVVAIRAVAGGALSGAAVAHSYSADLPPLVAAEAAGDRARAQAYRFMAETPDGLAEAAMRFVLAQEAVASTVVGISDLQQLHEALRAVVAGPLEPEIVDRIEATQDELFLTV